MRSGTLSVSGTLSGAFEGIRTKAFVNQDKEDRKAEPEVGFIFDIPTDLVDSLTGYLYCRSRGKCLLASKTLKRASLPLMRQESNHRFVP
jgi:hypothetical protein